MKSIEKIFEGMFDADYDLSLEIPDTSVLKGSPDIRDSYLDVVRRLIDEDRFRAAQIYSEIEKIKPNLQHIFDILNEPSVKSIDIRQIYENTRDLLGVFERNAKNNDYNKQLEKMMKNIPVVEDILKANADLLKLGYVDMVYIYGPRKGEFIEFWIEDVASDEDVVAIEKYFKTVKFKSMKLDKIKDAPNIKVDWKKSFFFKI